MFTKYLEDWREEKTAQEIKTGAVKCDVVFRKNLRRPVEATSKDRRREKPDDDISSPAKFLRRIAGADSSADLSSTEDWL